MGWTITFVHTSPVPAFPPLMLMLLEPAPLPIPLPIAWRIAITKKPDTWTLFLDATAACPILLSTLCTLCIRTLKGSCPTIQNGQSSRVTSLFSLPINLLCDKQLVLIPSRPCTQIVYTSHTLANTQSKMYSYIYTYNRMKMCNFI